MGVAARPTDRITLTADYYQLRLDDRIVLSSQFAVGLAESTQLASLGVPGAADIAQVRFFTNDVATRTSGVDVVASWHLDSKFGRTTVQTAVNANRTRVVERGRYVNAEGQYDLEHGLPEWRGVVTARHSWRDLDAMVRARYYGEYKNTRTADLVDIQVFGGEVMVDAELTWTLRDRYSLKAGAQNILDNYPDRARFENCCGRIYWRRSAVSWQGAVYYLQARVSWR